MESEKIIESVLGNIKRSSRERTKRKKVGEVNVHEKRVVAQLSDDPLEAFFGLTLFNLCKRHTREEVLVTKIDIILCYNNPTLCFAPILTAEISKDIHAMNRKTVWAVLDSFLSLNIALFENVFLHPNVIDIVYSVEIDLDGELLQEKKHELYSIEASQFVEWFTHSKASNLAIKSVKN